MRIMNAEASSVNYKKDSPEQTFQAGDDYLMIERPDSRIDRFRNLYLPKNISLKCIILMNGRPHACKRTISSDTLICKVIRM